MSAPPSLTALQREILAAASTGDLMYCTTPRCAVLAYGLERGWASSVDHLRRSGLLVVTRRRAGSVVLGLSADGAEALRSGVSPCDL